MLKPDLENKIPNLSSLVKQSKQNKTKKKADYNTKFVEIKKKLTDYNYDKYITTPEFNKLSAEVFDAR